MARLKSQKRITVLKRKCTWDAPLPTAFDDLEGHFDLAEVLIGG
jgi:hypothetical protein